MKHITKTILALLLLLSSLNAKEIYATFTVEPLHDAKLAFISSGIVNRVNVDISSHVKKGEILASLANQDIKAMLEVSKTALKYAKKDYERQLKIKELLDEAKFDGVAYRYENAKNQLAYQQALYNKTFLKAPFSGVIYAKDIDLGDAVSGMMLKTVYKIQSTSARKLLLDIDQKYYKDIKIGDTFKYTIDGDSKKYLGKISKIYPVANTNNRKIQAEVKAKNFMVGLFGNGTIKTK